MLIFAHNIFSSSPISCGFHCIFVLSPSGIRFLPLNLAILSTTACNSLQYLQLTQYSLFFLHFITVNKIQAVSVRF